MNGLIEQAASLGPAAFFFLSALAAAFGLPGLPFGMAAGAAFGPAVGILCSLAGGATGSALAFLAARRLTGLIPPKALPSGWKALAAGIRVNGPWLVILARLSPVCPFGPATAAFAASGMSFWTFCACSTLGLAPMAVAYAEAGALGRLAFTDPRVESYRLMGLAATLALCWWGHRRLKPVIARKA